MKQTWRWFGPPDITSIDDAAQAGAQGVVSALHHIPPGAPWPPEEIAKRQQQIARLKNGAPSRLTWDVVESLPVSEDIKKQQGAWRTHLAAYRESLHNIANAGIRVICYNFMPLLDWTRTDLAWRLPNGGTCLRFDMVDFAAFDMHILARPGAAEDHDEPLRTAAGERAAAMSATRKQTIARNVLCGLPGEAQAPSLETLREQLRDYDAIKEETLRTHLIDFLAEVAPTAEKLGLQLCCHPDDPPIPLLGLPRVMSTEQHYKKVMDAVDLPANGITLCAGSLGARPDNDLPGMMTRLGERVRFLHLRNVTRETEGPHCSFHEAEHLAGDIDMVALIAAALKEEARRKAQGRADCSLPMRPDHGHDILDDLKRGARPGYPSIGRLKGLAELRGVITALEAHSDTRSNAGNGAQ